MFSKTDLITGTIAVVFIAVAIFMLQRQTDTMAIAQPMPASQPAALSVAAAPGDVQTEQIIETNTPTMKITDITIGSGAAVAPGDTVVVHYVGTLQDGTEFDSSKKRGEPFTFTVGAGRVIAGWEEGLVDMQVGGSRTLVIPPEKAYGAGGFGPIPPNSTLVFTIELLAIE